MSSGTGVIGVFSHLDATIQAIRELKKKGYKELRVHSPVPNHEIEEEMEGKSYVPFFTLIGGLLGCASGFALTIWTALKWNLIVGGKPVVAIPPFIIIAFELTILLGALGTLLGLLVSAGLPRFKRDASYHHGFSNDRFGIFVRCTSDLTQGAQEVFEALGAEEVRVENG